MQKESLTHMVIIDNETGEITLPEGLSQAAIALATGVSKATVSRVVAGKYPKESDAYRKVVDYIESWTSARIQPPTPDGAAAFTTGGQSLMSAVLEAAVEDGEFVVLDSPTGVGKSHCIKLFKARHPEAIVFQAKYRQRYGAVLEALCRALGQPVSGTNETRQDRILSHAKGLVLVVDEADLLVAGRIGEQVMQILELFRQIYEAGAVVILVGLPELTRQLAQCGQTYIFSRIGYFRAIKPTSQEELARFWEFLMADMPEVLPKAGLVAAQASRNGMMRYLDKLARRTRLLGGDVEAAISLLYRPEATK